MSFKKNKYCVIKEAVPKDIATFVYNYFMMKRQVTKTLFDEKYISNERYLYGMMNKCQILILIMQI